MDKVRIGIVGAGAISEQAHVRMYAQQKDVEIVAIADINRERAQHVADKFDIPHVYESEHDLFARDDIDAVSICTPNALHASQAIAALGSDKHVLVEKPMCLSLAEADEMIRVAAEKGKSVMVGFTHRFFTHNVYVKEQLEKGTIGEPLSFRIRFAHNGPYQSWAAKSSWFFDKALAGGGALLDMGIHAIDLLRYFGGEFKSVQGSVATLKHKIDVEDYAGALVEFESGARGQLEVGWYSLPGFSGYEIYGTEGSIICNYQTVRTYRTIDGEGQWVERNAGGGGWDREIQFFVDAVKAGKLLNCTAEDGKIALKWALHLYRSGERNG